MLVEMKGKFLEETNTFNYLFFIHSAFSNPQLMQRQQQQQHRSQWQPSLQDQQAFQGASMGDWGKSQQYRGPPKGPSSLNHPPPPPHASFGGYRPYM